MRHRILKSGNAAGARILVIAFVAVLAGCGGRAYVHEPLDLAGIRDRAETQIDGPLRVSASVPGREETSRIFGIDLYDQGIQPIWLEIANSGTDRARYAMVSTDHYYFTPFEIAYKNRSGFSDEARAEMERHFNEHTMSRYVDSGETRSGFVFTHADTGAKGFNVDLFSKGGSYYFNFLLRVPGFVPDYANFDPETIYKEDEIAVYPAEGLYDGLKQLPCCSSDETGDEIRAAINVVLVGAGRDLVIALLRSSWLETSEAESADLGENFLFGRKQDAIFRYESFADDSFYELRLWLAPMRSGDDRVWVGQVRHFFTSGNSFRRNDPDVDNARNVAFQHFLYGQSVEQIGWLAGKQVVPVESFWENLIRPSYFTDGHRLVLWLSGEPVSLLDAIALDWDAAPEVK
jgi:hypothetical protein